ncbi:hypothetical protein K438DRAFT_2100850 [Mycena galopus ATCC 62051]|nr:hypothetical protein K438DRAFT_2100850 [Mycena galopus ATCC 62051]
MPLALWHATPSLATLMSCLSSSTAIRHPATRLPQCPFPDLGAAPFACIESLLKLPWQAVPVASCSTYQRFTNISEDMQESNLRLRGMGVRWARPQDKHRQGHCVCERSEEPAAVQKAMEGILSVLCAYESADKDTGAAYILAAGNGATNADYIAFIDEPFSDLLNALSPLASTSKTTALMSALKTGRAGRHVTELVRMRLGSVAYYLHNMLKIIEPPLLPPPSRCPRRNKPRSHRALESRALPLPPRLYLLSLLPLHPGLPNTGSSFFFHVSLLTGVASALMLMFLSVMTGAVIYQGWMGVR